MSNPHRELLDFMDQRFSLADIRRLCYDLSVACEHLRGETKPDKIIGLIQTLQRHGRLPELITSLEHYRPHLHWPDPFPAATVPASPGAHITNPFFVGGRIHDPRHFFGQSRHNK
jgi:hypothetical protein